MLRGPVAGEKETPETGIASCKNVRFGGSLQVVRASAAGVFAIAPAALRPATVARSCRSVEKPCRSRVNVPASRRGFFPAICSVIFAPAAFAALRRIGRFKGRDRRSVAPRAAACSSIRLLCAGQEPLSRRRFRRRVGQPWTAFSGLPGSRPACAARRNCLCAGRSIGHLIVRCSDSGRCIMHRIGYCIDHCIGCRGCS